eukprot:2428009-Pleurochrysis_carterae.AAC.1
MARKDTQSRLGENKPCFLKAGKPSLAESSTRQRLCNMALALVREFLGTCETLNPKHRGNVEVPRRRRTRHRFPGGVAAGEVCVGARRGELPCGGWEGHTSFGAKWRRSLSQRPSVGACVNPKVTLCVRVAFCSTCLTAATRIGTPCSSARSVCVCFACASDAVSVAGGRNA